ncbi:1-acyl-sn-glycerol-3-phosphate acyltransferase [Pseudobacteriovorax antillogorgiicola]|nr:1-acyl-sn-glycerol-3-phosphate acyltransferase [Pseudobacteriovorax antillogorgiicola]
MTGWTVEGSYPDRQSIIIVAPHTSNWDFIYFLFLCMKWEKLGSVMWIGKHTLFRGPFKSILTAMGGKPVNRKKNNNIIRIVTNHLKDDPSMCFALAPEGTRSYTNHWKKGFYRMAQRSGLPIAFAFIDFKDRRIGIGPSLDVTGDQEQDWDVIRNFYRKEWAAYPDQFSDMRY